ncbi:MAG: tryptophan 7-halogenase, partial [Planctomycetaceae bacterium]|nr:tryptophan 7-halogenase [Planctomycetaceae bacterium]
MASEQIVAGRLPRRLVIVGSGETAWMAAAVISLSAGPLVRKITVVTESDPREEFPAETTQPSLTRLLQNPGFDEQEMMRRADATWSLAKQFSDWVRLDRDFWVPHFGGPLTLGPATFFQAWHAERVQGRLLRPLHSYAMQWAAALAGKAPAGFSHPSTITRSLAYGFHVDGTGLANAFRQIALTHGVEEIRGQTAVVNPNGRGGVAQLKLVDGQIIAGDFFLDCSADAGVLSQVAATGPWHEDPDPTVCRRLMEIRLPPRRQIPPWT